MKALAIFLIGFFCLYSVQADSPPKADSPDGFIESVASAIKSGNAAKLASYFAPLLDLTIHDEDDTYSKAQAQQIIASFFKKNPPADFKILHKGTSDLGAQYCIGSYSSTNGNEFRTYFLFKKTKGINKIHQLQFAEE